MEDLDQTTRMAGTEARFDRFRIGDIACTALSDGGILVHRPAPPAAERTAGAATEVLPSQAPQLILVPLACLVAQMPGTNQMVLIDSGFGLTPEMLGKPMPSAGRLRDSLETAGLHVDGIDVVLISHFDIDHVAGLYDREGAQVFPNATYYAPAEAVRFWSKKDVNLRESPTLPWIKQERLMVSAHVLKSGGKRNRTFRAGEEVLPGIKAVDLPGHAPGQVGFLLESEGETLLYTADALTHPTVSIETPEIFNIMDQDPHVAVRTRQDLITSLSVSNARSFSPHFSWPAWGRVTNQDGKPVWKSGG